VSADVINTLLILGAAQGLFLAVLLATKRTNSTANRLLAVAMLSFSLFALQGVYYARGYYTEYPHFIGMSAPLVFVFGPVLYLYAQAVSSGGHAFPKSSLLHFLPFAAVILYLVPFFLETGEEKIEFLGRLDRGDSPLGLAIIQHLQYAHGILYVALTIRVLRRHRERLRDAQSPVERIHLDWLRNVTVAVVAVWALAVGLYLLDVLGVAVGKVPPTLTALAVALMVYWLGYLGLRQPEIFNVATPNAAAAAAVPPTPAGRLTPGTAAALAPAQAEAHAQRLVRLMEEKQLYKRSLLTLPELAGELSISAPELTAVLDGQLGKSFDDFVDAYRVEEVKRRLRDPGSSHLTILSIAQRAGFDTATEFDACFRKHTGLTPSQYRARHADTPAERSHDGGAVVVTVDPIADVQAAVGATYEIERELGRGGMATVFLARDRKHRRPVAVKVCRANMGPDDTGGARFEREIETAARLSHPHILPLYDSGVAGDLLWYVMPVVTGESLRERIAREGRLPLGDALRLTAEVAEALDYAHANGVVHRDVKPSNILISHGHALVADFGLARAIRSGGARYDATLTRSGMAVGTPLYMSPEQFGGRPDVDGRADQYSLACVLYEMLCGVPPFAGETAEEVLVAHIAHRAPPLAANGGSAPPAVEAALARALSKKPAERFATMAEFAHALSAAAASPGAAPAAGPWRRYAARAIGAIKRMGSD
jgi:AraC-like DNA-binding protein